MNRAPLVCAKRKASNNAMARQNLLIQTFNKFLPFFSFGIFFVSSLLLSDF